MTSIHSGTSVPSPTPNPALATEASPSTQRSEFCLFGHVGIEAYQRYHPVAPNEPDYAIKQVEAAFADRPENQKAIAGRAAYWANYERLLTGFASPSDLPAMETIFSLIKEISPLAKTQLEGAKTGLGLHLQEVSDFCRAFFQTESGESRFPRLLSNRQAALMVEIIAPLHDVLKYLGAPDAQIMPDHEVITAELARKNFAGKLVTIAGKESKLTQRDADFISSVIGDHENINKELGRSEWVSSKHSTERAKALFFVADVLTGALRENPEGSNNWKFDPVQLDNRFIDLYFRHIDPVKGKVFRPEWALHAVSDLANTLDKVIASGASIEGAAPGESPRDTLINAALEGLNRAFKADEDRWQTARAGGATAPEKFLSDAQLERMRATQAALFELKAKSLQARAEQ